MVTEQDNPPLEPSPRPILFAFVMAAVFAAVALGLGALVIMR